jgi:hypothetical protein
MLFVSMLLFEGRFLSLVFNRRPTNYLSSPRICVSNGLQLAMVIDMVRISILRLVLPSLLTELESRGELWPDTGFSV